MKKFALIGEKLGHSYSKIIHERYFELSGKKDYTYDLIEIPKDELEKEFLRISGEYDGINVTIPYKIDVIKYLDAISPEAEKIGAANTILLKNGKVFGYNTDYFGFKYMLETNDIEIKNKNVVILGTGGASKAALAVCEDMQASSVSFVTTKSASYGNYKTLSYNDKIKGDVLVNCTPVGMYPKMDVSPLNELDLSFNAVVDMIYNPAVTKLMEKGISNGIKSVNGLYMLVAQAIKAQAVWNNEDFDKCITDKIYSELKDYIYKR